MFQFMINKTIQILAKVYRKSPTSQIGHLGATDHRLPSLEKRKGNADHGKNASDSPLSEADGSLLEVFFIIEFNTGKVEKRQGCMYIKGW